MAQLIITIPDVAVPRIRTALGRFDLVTNSRIDATQQEVLDAIKGFLKSQVVEYETTLAAQAARDQKSQEVW